MAFTKAYAGGWQSGTGGGTPMVATALDLWDTGMITAHKVVDFFGGATGTWVLASDIPAAGSVLISQGTKPVWVATGNFHLASGGAVTAGQNVEIKGQGFSATHTITASGSNLPVNCDNGNVQTHTLTGNRTLVNPTALKNGSAYTFILKQDATGGRTLAFGTVYKHAAGVDPTLATAANAVTVLSYISDGTNLYGSSIIDAK